jgi:glyoxylase-like metal-dependent hydrolase (beta-lactamase superfamily II)
MSAVAFDRDHRFRYRVPEQVSPGIRRVTARNPGPYTFYGTGTYIVGRDRVAVIDPGPLLDEHVAALESAVAGEEVACILVTHCHRDHSPASRALAASTAAPVLAFGRHGTQRGPHESGEEGVDRDFAPDRRLTHGERIHGPGWTIECLHTPGHTSDHMCFALVEERALFSGDHVMAWSTSVISPPDGDLGDYLDSLRLLLERPDRVYWPTHGPPVTDPRRYVAGLIAHRQRRLEQILGACDAGIDSPRRLVEHLYADLEPRLKGAALRSTLAGIEWLVRRGLLALDGPLSGDSTIRRPAGVSADGPGPR